MTKHFEFESPGPGTWEMDAAHCPKPLFGMVREVLAYALPTGIAESCRRYGLPLETLLLRFVHGFPYVQPKPVGAPAGGGKPPPRFVFRLVTALHPEIRRRMKTASTLFIRRPWLAELAEWDETVKPRSIALHREWAGIDPSPFDDAALADHLDGLFEHACAMGAQDHRFTLTYAIPLGDFLLQAAEWTGLGHADLLQLFRGSSDISGGDCDERRALVAALREDTEALALLDDLKDPQATLATLRGREGDVGQASRAFFDVHGNGLAHGISMVMPSINEDPAATLSALRRTATTPDRRTNGVATHEQKVRGLVPADKLAQFEQLLDDARTVYRLRDERHLYGVLPTLGPARRAILEAGARLSQRAVLSDAELALYATHVELTAALRGTAPLDIAELRGRQERYETLDATNIPLRLGPPPAPPPPIEWLPNDGARRVMGAMLVFMGHMDVVDDSDASTTAPSAPEPSTPGPSTPGSSTPGSSTTAERPTDVISGLAISRGVVEGTARIIHTPEDLTRIQQGDILVAATTTPAINVVLPLLGGLVTDRGGVLSHAAIVAREFDIPGVVGTRRATLTIREGDRVRVNGESGSVEVLS